MDWSNYLPYQPPAYSTRQTDPCRPKVFLTQRQLTRLRSRLESLKRIVDGLRAPAELADDLRGELAQILFEELQPQIIELVLDVLAEAKGPRRRPRTRAAGD